MFDCRRGDALSLNSCRMLWGAYQSSECFLFFSTSEAYPSVLNSCRMFTPISAGMANLPNIVSCSHWRLCGLSWAAVLNQAVPCPLAGRARPVLNCAAPHHHPVRTTHLKPWAAPFKSYVSLPGQVIRALSTPFYRPVGLTRPTPWVTHVKKWCDLSWSGFPKHTAPHLLVSRADLSNAVSCSHQEVAWALLIGQPLGHWLGARAGAGREHQMVRR